MRLIKAGCIGAILFSLGFAADFARDFRTRDFDNGSFLMSGQDAEQFLEAGPAGLRIKLLDGAAHGPTGVTTRFPIRGDFEITLAYEIKKAETPKAGYGVGVGLYIETDSPTKEGITLERFVMPDQSEVFASTRATMKDGERVYLSNRFPARSARSGRLRLSRVGSMVGVAVSDTSDAPFRELQNVEVGSGDLVVLRLAGDTGGSPSRMDAYLQNLQITAQDFTRSNLRNSLLASPWTRWLAGAIAVVAAGATFLYLRGRSGETPEMTS